MQYLFCPKCNHQNHISPSEFIICHICKEKYSFARQKQRLAEELSGSAGEYLGNMPKTNKITLKDKGEYRLIRVKKSGKDLKLRKNEVQEVKVNFFLIGFALLLIIAISILLSVFVHWVIFLGFILLPLFLFLYDPDYLEQAFAFFYEDILSKNHLKELHYRFTSARAINFKLFHGKIEFEDNGNERTLYGIEASDIYYNFEGLNSSVRLRLVGNQEDLILSGGLNPAEARWLALFLRENLKLGDIGQA